MKTEQELRSRIMRNVYGVYFLRAVSAPAIRLAVLGALAFALKELISVTSVFENLSHTNGVSGLFYYAFSAFTGTELLVQLTLIAGTFVALVSVRDLLSGVTGRASYV